jgi:hypothetical protein
LVEEIDRRPMTKAQYLQSHIPHRVNILATFRERFSDPKTPGYVEPESARDFYRCAKDGALLMIRFFCEEMGGIVLTAKATDITQRQQHQWCPFLCRRLTVAELKALPCYGDVHDALVAAEWTISHVHPASATHAYDDAVRDLRLADATSAIERLVVSHIYGSDSAYDAAMRRPGNILHRVRAIRGWNQRAHDPWR